MANQFQTVTSGVAELKTWFQGPMVDGLNEDCKIYRASEKIKSKWDGYYVARPLRLIRNQGVGATSDNGNLPSIGRQGTVQAQIYNKYNYLRFGITGPMIKQSMTDRGSFVRSASFELEMGYKDLTSELNRQLSWNGNGDLAAVNANAVASASIVIKGRESTEAALKFLDIGSTVDIYSGSTPVATGVTINAITSGNANSSTATITLSQVVTVSADDILIRSGSYGNEIQGLLYALDGLTTTVYGVDRANYLAYQGNVVNLAGAQLTIDDMQRTWNEGMRRGNVGKYSAAYCDFTTLRFYQKLLSPDKRYVNTVKGDGAFGSPGDYYMDFSGLPMVADKDCPTRIFFLPQQAMELYVNCEMEFADEQGTMYIAQSDVDSYEVRIRQFCNFFNSQPAACGVVRNYISP